MGGLWRLKKRGSSNVLVIYFHTFQLKPLHTDDVNNETSCTSAGDRALSHTDDPGGDIDDPGGGFTNSTNDWGSFFSSCFMVAN